MMIMSVSSVGLFMLSDSNSGFSTDDYSESAEYGKSGERDFGAVCDEDDYATRILLGTQQVGPHVAGKRHHRISAIGVQCRKGGRKKFGVGSSDSMTTTNECKNKNDGFIGARFWVTDDAVQRVEPVCPQYGQWSGGSGASDVGSEIGTNSKYMCPDGKRLAGFSGTYNDQLKSIRAHCRS